MIIIIKIIICILKFLFYQRLLSEIFTERFYSNFNLFGIMIQGQGRFFFKIGLLWCFLGVLWRSLLRLLGEWLLLLKWCFFLGWSYTDWSSCNNILRFILREEVIQIHSLLKIFLCIRRDLTKNIRKGKGLENIVLLTKNMDTNVGIL